MQKRNRSELHVANHLIEKINVAWPKWKRISFFCFAWHSRGGSGHSLGCACAPSEQTQPFWARKSLSVAQIGEQYTFRYSIKERTSYNREKETTKIQRPRVLKNQLIALSHPSCLNNWEEMTVRVAMTKKMMLRDRVLPLPLLNQQEAWTLMSMTVRWEFPQCTLVKQIGWVWWGRDWHGRMEESLRTQWFQPQ